MPLGRMLSICHAGISMIRLWGDAGLSYIFCPDILYESPSRVARVLSFRVSSPVFGSVLFLSVAVVDTGPVRRTLQSNTSIRHQ